MNNDETARLQGYRDAVRTVQAVGVAFLVGVWYLGTQALTDPISPIPLPAVDVAVPPVVTAGFLLANVIALIVVGEHGGNDE